MRVVLKCLSEENGAPFVTMAGAGTTLMWCAISLAMLEQMQHTPELVQGLGWGVEGSGSLILPAKAQRQTSCNALPLTPSGNTAVTMQKMQDSGVLTDVSTTLSLVAPM